MSYQVGNFYQKFQNPHAFGLDSVRFDAFVVNLSLENL